VRTATAPFTLISAVSPATSSSVITRSRTRLSPTRATSCCPAQAVTPVASRLSLTTKSAAMKSTAGSPKPASAWFRSSTPVAHSESAVATATTATGNRSRMNTTTTAPSTRKVIVWSLTAVARRPLPARPDQVCTGEPGPSGIPIRYQTTKKIVQRTDRITT